MCGAGRSVSLGLKFKSSTVQKGITKVVPFLVRSRRDSRRGKAPVTPAHSQMLPRSICALKGRSRSNPSMQKRNHKSGSFLARSRRDSNPRHGVGGIRTLVPGLTDKRISSAPRYGRFDTTPQTLILTKKRLTFKTKLTGCPFLLKYGNLNLSRDVSKILA